MKYVFFLLSILSATALYAEEAPDVFESVNHAEETPDIFEPANLKNTKTSLQSRITFPKKVLKSEIYENIVVRCDALVSRRGKFNLNFCYEKDKKLFPYVTAINIAAKRSTIKPGRVNGTVRNVWFQYYVVFLNSKDKHSVEVVPNSGLEASKYGFDYTSAQRYREGGGIFGIGCINNDSTVNGIIDEFGIPSEIKVVGEGVGDKCKRNLKEQFFEQRFIPAMVNGVAVKSFYSEEIFDRYREQ